MHQSPVRIMHQSPIRFMHQSPIFWRSGTRFPQQFLGQVDVVVGYESDSSLWGEGNFQGICPPPAFLKTVGDPGYCQTSGLNDTQLYW